MNIFFQVAGLCNMIVILILFGLSKKIGLKTQKAFWILIVCEFLCLISDIICCIFLYNYANGNVNINAVKASTRVYLVCLFGLIYSAFNYVLRDTLNTTKWLKIELPVACSVLLSGVLLASLLPLDVININGAYYSAGPATIVTFIYGVLVLAFCSVFIFMNHNEMNSTRIKAFFGWTSIWFASAIVELIFKDFLIITFGTTLGVLIMFIRLENPTRNLDSDTNLFNMNGYVDFVRQTYASKQYFKIIRIKLDFTSDTLSDEIKKTILKDFAKGLNVLNNYNAYKENDSIYYLTNMDQFVNPDETLMLVNNTIYYSTYVKLSAIVINNPYDFDNVQDISKTFEFINNKHLADNMLAYYVDRNIVKIMKQEKSNTEILKKAIDLELIDIYYQPIYNIKDDCYDTCEALARLKDTNNNIILPDNFIDIAEETGLILPLGEIIFRKICNFLKNNNLKDYGIKQVGVNLSKLQSSTKDIANRIRGIIDGYDIDPSIINFEVTEVTSAQGRNIALDNMAKLIECGVSFSLDDFGTSNSTLNYLVEMPITFVKFDNILVNSYLNNPQTKCVMDASINMINSLDLEIGLEGIETLEQYEAAKALDIKYMQGFYLSKPLSEKEFIDFIKRK